MTDMSEKWKVDQVGTAHQPVIRDSSDRCIACVGNAEPWAEAKPQWMKHAHMMAAAPELYEALEQLLMRWLDPGSITDAQWHAAKSALSKARGDTAIPPPPTEGE